MTTRPSTTGWLPLRVRIAVAVVTLIGGAVRPEALGVPYSTVASVVVGYAAISIIFEAARRRSTRFNYSLLTVMLLIDGAFLLRRCT